MNHSGFNNVYNDSNFKFSIEKTVLLYENYQQLPKMSVFKESIARNYPDEFTDSDTELTNSFFRISHLIGRSINNNYSISAKDMVLLTILKDLIGDKTAIETSVARLSPLELAFLETIK